MKIPLLIRFILIACALSIGLTGCAVLNRDNSPIKIGLIASPEGELAQIGQSSIMSARLAVERVNSQGGLQIGRSQRLVELIIEDDHNLPDTSVDAARKLIQQDKVVALVGPPLSRTAIRVGAVAEEAAVPMISAGSTHPETTKNRLYAFRVGTVDRVQGQIMAQFAVRDLGLSRAAILYDAANPYSADVAQVFGEVFSTLGGVVVAKEVYATGETEFTPQLTAIRDSNPDILILPNYSHEVTVQIRAARVLGIDAQVAGSDSWNEYTEETLPPELEGSYFVAHFSSQLELEAAQEFVAIYRERYGVAPDESAALTFDAFSLLFRAMETQNSSDPVRIGEALRFGPTFEGASGPLTYTGSGDPARAAVILQIKDGRIMPTRLIMSEDVGTEQQP